tara:strand:- start:207773 stop:209026 length:1254 start_codon:yes stop_codon:yes gene_type:complete
MLVGSVTALFIKVLAAGGVFFMNVVIARKLGANEAGLFFLGFTLTFILAAFARMGLDNSLIRFISSTSQPDKVHGIYRKALVWSTVLSLLTSGLLIYLAKPISTYIFKQPGFYEVLIVTALAIPFSAIYTINTFALQGLKKIAKGMITLNIVVPFSILFCILIFPINTAILTAWIYLGACGIAVSISYYWWLISSPRSSTRTAFASKTILASCLPLWGVTVLTQVIQWSSQLMIGVWATSTDVALFTTAQRTAMLTSFVLIAINAIAAPKFAMMYSKGDTEGLRRIALLSARLLLVAAVPAIGFIFIFPEWLMGLFGEDFKGAANILIILAAGQFINIAAGSVDILLSMTGHERELRLNVFLGAILGVILGVLLIPTHGILGGAIATTCAVSSRSILGVYQVNRLLGFNTLAFWRKL